MHGQPFCVASQRENSFLLKLKDIFLKSLQCGRDELHLALAAAVLQRAKPMFSVELNIQIANSTPEIQNVHSYFHLLFFIFICDLDCTRHAKRKQSHFLSLLLYLDNNVWFADSSWNVDRTTEGFYSRIKMVENSFDVCGISQCGRLQTHFFFWQFKLTEQTKYPWSQILSIRLDSNNCLWLDNS